MFQTQLRTPVAQSSNDHYATAGLLATVLGITTPIEVGVDHVTSVEADARNQLMHALNGNVERALDAVKSALLTTLNPVNMDGIIVYTYFIYRTAVAFAIIGVGLVFPYSFFPMTLCNAIAWSGLVANFNLARHGFSVQASPFNYALGMIVPTLAVMTAYVLAVEADAHNQLMHASNGNTKRALEADIVVAAPVPIVPLSQMVVVDGIRLFTIRSQQDMHFLVLYHNNKPDDVTYTFGLAASTDECITMLLSAMRYTRRQAVVYAFPITTRQSCQLQFDSIICMAKSRSPAWQQEQREVVMARNRAGTYRNVQDIDFFTDASAKFNKVDIDRFWNGVRNHELVKPITKSEFTLHMLRRSGVPISMAFKLWCYDHVLYKTKKVHEEHAAMLAGTQEMRMRSLIPYTPTQEKLLDLLKPESSLYDNVERGVPLGSSDLRLLRYILLQYMDTEEMVQTIDSYVSQTSVVKQSGTGKEGIDDILAKVNDKIVKTRAEVAAIEKMPKVTDSDDEDFQDAEPQYESPKSNTMTGAYTVDSSLGFKQTLVSSKMVHPSDLKKSGGVPPLSPQLAEVKQTQHTLPPADHDVDAGILHRWKKAFTDMFTIRLAPDVKAFVDAQTDKIAVAANDVSKKIRDVSSDARAAVEIAGAAATAAAANISQTVKDTVDAGLFGLSGHSDAFIRSTFGEQWVRPLGILFKFIKILAMAKVISESSPQNQAILLSLNAVQFGVVDTAVITMLSLLARQLFQPDSTIEKQGFQSHGPGLYLAFMGLIKYVTFGTWELSEKPKDVLAEVNSFVTLLKHGIPVAEKLLALFKFAVNKLGMWMFKFPIFDYVFGLQGDRLLSITKRAASMRTLKDAVGVVTDLDTLILEARDANATDDYMKKLVAVRIDVAHWMATRTLSTDQVYLIHLKDIQGMSMTDARSAYATIDKQLPYGEISPAVRTAWEQLGREIKSSIRTDELRAKIDALNLDDIDDVLAMRSWLTKYQINSDMPLSESTVIARTAQAIQARVRELGTIPISAEWRMVQQWYTNLSQLKEVTINDYLDCVALEAKISSLKISAAAEFVDPDVKRGIQNIAQGYNDLRRTLAARFATTGKTPVEQLLIVGRAGIGKTMMLDILCRLVAKKMLWPDDAARQWLYTPMTNFPTKYDHERFITVDDFNMINAEEVMNNVLDFMITQGSPVRTFPEDPIAEKKALTVFVNAVVFYTGNKDKWPDSADAGAVDRRLTLGRLDVTLNDKYANEAGFDITKIENNDFSDVWTFTEKDRKYNIYELADSIAATLVKRQQTSNIIKRTIEAAVEQAPIAINAEPIVRPAVTNLPDSQVRVRVPEYINVRPADIQYRVRRDATKQMKFGPADIDEIEKILKSRGVADNVETAIGPYRDLFGSDYEFRDYLRDADQTVYQFVNNLLETSGEGSLDFGGLDMKTIKSTIMTCPFNRPIKVCHEGGCPLVPGHKLMPCLVHGMDMCPGRKTAIRKAMTAKGSFELLPDGAITVAELQRLNTKLLPNVATVAYETSVAVLEAMKSFFTGYVVTGVVMLLVSPLVTYGITKLLMRYVGVDVEPQGTYYAADIPRHVKANRNIPVPKIAKQSEHGTFPESVEVKMSDNVDGVLNKVSQNVDAFYIGTSAAANHAKGYFLGIKHNIGVTLLHIFKDFIARHSQPDRIITIAKRYNVYDLKEIKDKYEPSFNTVQWYAVPGHDIALLFFPRTHPSYLNIEQLLLDDDLELQMIHTAQMLHIEFSKFEGPKGTEFLRGGRDTYEMGPAIEYADAVISDGASLPAGFWFRQNPARLTKEGDCGLPYMFPYHGRLTILGLHEAGGGGIAIAAPLSKTLVQNALEIIAYTGSDRPITKQADIVESIGGIEAVPGSIGPVKKEFKVHVSNKSKLVKSDIHGCLTNVEFSDWNGKVYRFPPCTAEPAKMGFYEGTTGMHRSMIKKHREPFYTPDEYVELVRRGASMNFDRIGPIPYDIRPLTWQEVLDGKPEWGINPVDHTTSPGPPITSWVPHKNGKDEWFTVEDGVRTWIPEMLGRLKELDQQVRAGIIPATYDEDSLKDELREVKIEMVDGKQIKTYKNVRNITNCDNAINFLVRRYCGPVTGYFSKNRILNGMLAGTDLNSLDGVMLAARLATGKKYDWDITNKDGNTRTQFALISHEEIDMRLAKPYYDAEEMTALSTLGYTATQAICVADGMVYSSPDGLRSGNVFTTPLNMKDGQTIVMTAYLWKNGIDKSLDDFLRDADVYNYNDDMITVDKTGKLTGEDVKTAAKLIFNYDLTDARKTPTLKDVPLSEVSILKRSPIASPIGMVWVLDRQAMVRTIDYVWKGVNFAKNHTEVVQALLNEMALYGPKAFIAVRDILNLALVRSSHVACSLTFEQAWNSVRQRRGLKTQGLQSTTDQAWCSTIQATAVKLPRSVEGCKQMGVSAVETHLDSTSTSKTSSEAVPQTQTVDNTKPEGVQNNGTVSSVAAMTAYTDTTLVTKAKMPTTLDLSSLGSGTTAREKMAAQDHSYQIYTITFGSTATSGYGLGHIILPDVLLGKSKVIAALYGKRFFRADVLVRLSVTCSPYVAGAVAITILPWFKYTASANPNFPHQDTLSLLSNATHILNIAPGETLEIRVPWAAPIPFMDLMNTVAQGGCGTMFLTVLHPTVSSVDSTPPDVTITAYASLENVVTDGPTLEGIALPMPKSLPAVKKQSGFEDITKSAQGVMNILGGAVKTVTDVASIVESNPAILTLIAGLDKPASVQAPTLTMHRPIQGWQHGSGLDASASLSITPDATVARKSVYGDASSGTPSITDVITKPGRVLTLKFDNTTPTSSLLTCLPVKALQGIYLPASGGTQYAMMYPIPVSYVAPHFACWKGGFNYLIFTTMPRGVVGKLRVSFVVDVDDVVSPIPADRSGDVPSLVLDLSGTTIHKIHVPWCSTKPFLEVTGNAGPPNVITEGNCMGLLKFQLVTPLASQAGDVAASAYMSVYASADSSFEFINPVAISKRWTGSWIDWWGGNPPDPPTARIDYSVIKKQAALHEEFGKPFSSLWESKTRTDKGIYSSEKMPDIPMMSKRVQEVVTYWLDADNTDQSIYLDDNVNDPTSGGTGYPGNFRGFMSKLFRGWRGSLIYKFFLSKNSTATNQPQIVKFRLLSTEYDGGWLDNSLGDGLIACQMMNSDGLYEFRMPWLHQQAWRETQEVQYWEWNTTPHGGGDVRDWQLRLEYPHLNVVEGVPSVVQFMSAGDDYSLGLYMGPPALHYYDPPVTGKSSGKTPSMKLPD